jgi:hypothetical protein
MLTTKNLIYAEKNEFVDPHEEISANNISSSYEGKETLL